MSKALVVVMLALIGFALAVWLAVGRVAPIVREEAGVRDAALVPQTANASVANTRTPASASSLDDSALAPAPSEVRVKANFAPKLALGDPAQAPAADEAHISGWIALQDGTPTHAARVAAFEMQDGAPRERAVAESACDERGVYRLDIKNPRALVLLAYSKGCEPATRRIEANAGAETAVDVITLAPGVEITGEIAVNGTPLARVEIVAALTQDAPVLRAGDGSFKWIDRAFVWSFATAESKSDGSYRIGGLRKAGYRVQIATIRGASAIFGWAASGERRVDAPHAQVDFALDSASLTFKFLRDGDPAPRVRVQLQSGEALLETNSDEHGMCRVKTVPNLACTLAAYVDGCEPRKMPLNAPAAGEERTEVVVLQTIVPKPSLLLELVTRDHAPIGRVHVLMFDPNDGAQPVLDVEGKSSHARSSDPTFTKSGKDDRRFEELLEQAKRHPNSFTIEGVPPGTYRAVIQAGESLFPSAPEAAHRTCYTYCDSELVITIPRTGKLEQIVEIERRGSLRITARGARGEILPLRTLLRDAQGHSVATRVREPSDKPSAVSGSIVTGLGSPEPSSIELYTALCSGPCELELSWVGHRSVRVKTEIIAGAITPIEVVLEDL